MPFSLRALNEWEKKATAESEWYYAVESNRRYMSQEAAEAYADRMSFTKRPEGGYRKDWREKLSRDCSFLFES